jgi:hypothetical protein
MAEMILLVLIGLLVLLIVGGLGDFTLLKKGRTYECFIGAITTIMVVIAVIFTAII